jgi:cyclase
MNQRNIHNIVVAALAAVWGLCAGAPPVVAQSPPIPIYLVHPLRGDVVWIEGGAGSNNGFIIGEKGVIEIDTKTTMESERIELGELATVTSKPVTTVILTHSDSDHTLGLPALPHGLTIIAQENCAKQLQAASAQGGAAALPKEYLPTKTVGAMESLTIDGVRLVLLHKAPAHSVGDLVIYLPEQKIAFTGDAYNSRLPGPYMHIDAGASPAGWIEEMHQMIGLDAELYVTGHGSLAMRSELARSVAASEKEQAAVKALVAQGKTLSEIQAALGESASKPLQHADGRTLPFFSEYVYAELTKK